jgi:hypothetical protein
VYEATPANWKKLSAVDEEVVDGMKGSPASSDP